MSTVYGIFLAWLFAFLISVGSGAPVIDISDDLLMKMSMVAKGESAIDPVHPACVMRNRIIRGWNPNLVLNHFYARPRAVTPEEYEMVSAAIKFGLGCNPDAYFQWSLADEKRIMPNPKAFLFEVNGNVYYTIDALRRP